MTTVDPNLRDLAYTVLGPHSQTFLQSSGIRRGMRVLELGCGNGAMTGWLAKQIGPSGQLTSIDVNQNALSQARSALDPSLLKQVTFVSCRAEEFKTDGAGFDVIYSRLFLMQLPDPASVLQKAKSWLNPDGVLICDEPNQEADRISRVCPPCTRANKVFLEFADQTGRDFRIGDKLYETLAKAGFHIRTAQSVQPIMPLKLALQMFKHGILDSIDGLVQLGISSRSGLERLIRELDEFQTLESDWYALSRQTQIAATHPIIDQGEE